MSPKQISLSRLAAKCSGDTSKSKVSNALRLLAACSKEIAIRSLDNSPPPEMLAEMCLAMENGPGTPSSALDIWEEVARSVAAEQKTQELFIERAAERAAVWGRLEYDLDLSIEKWLAKLLPGKRPAARMERLRQYFKARQGNAHDGVTDLSQPKINLARSLANLHDALRETECFLAWHHAETQKSLKERARKGGRGRQQT